MVHEVNNMPMPESPRKIAPTDCSMSGTATLLAQLQVTHASRHVNQSNIKPNCAMCSHCAPVCGRRLFPVPTARKRVLPLSRSCMRQPLDLCQVRPATALLYSNSLPCHDTGWAVDMTCHERVMNVSWTCHGHKRIFTFRVNSCPVLPQPSLLLLHSCC